jgi:hypothetical protein
LGYPILLFENASATDAMGKAYNIAKDNYGTFFVVSLLGLILAFADFSCCIGVILTGAFMIRNVFHILCLFRKTKADNV